MTADWWSHLTDGDRPLDIALDVHPQDVAAAQRHYGHEIGLATSQPSRARGHARVASWPDGRISLFAAYQVVHRVTPIVACRRVTEPAAAGTREGGGGTPLTVGPAPNVPGWPARCTVLFPLALDRPRQRAIPSCRAPLPVERTPGDKLNNRSLEFRPRRSTSLPFLQSVRATTFEVKDRC